MKTVNAKSKYSLQRTMIVYFLLIGFASLLVGVEFVVEAQDPALKMDLLANFESFSQGILDQEAVFAPIDRLRDKALLMMGIILCVMLIVLTMFIKNITEPLQHMIEISKKISRGDLSRTIRIQSDNELAELGNVINEMSSNLQEIILLSKNMCASGRETILRTEQHLDAPLEEAEKIGRVREGISKLKNELDVLNDMVDCFDFYTMED